MATSNGTELPDSYPGIVKRGYDPDGNGWLWRVYDADGDGVGPWTRKPTAERTLRILLDSGRAAAVAFAVGNR